MDTDQITQIASLVISVMALTGVYFAWRSIQSTRTWNGVLAASVLLDTSRFDELTDRADAALKTIKVDVSSPISRDDAERIVSNHDVEKTVTRLLTFMERTSAMVNSGAIDDELAYQFMVGQVVSTYGLFTEFIALKREARKDEEIMGELGALATRWNAEKKRRKQKKMKVMAKRRPGL